LSSHKYSLSAVQSFLLTGRGLVGAVTHYRSLCNELCSRVDQQRLFTFTDFFFSTFMQHYRLYQCVMSRSPLRESVTSSLVLPVHGPPRPIQPLNKGMDPDVWEYKKAVRKLEQEHEETKKKRRAEKCDQEKEEAGQLADVQCRISDLDDPVDSQVRNNFRSCPACVCLTVSLVRLAYCFLFNSVYCQWFFTVGQKSATVGLNLYIFIMRSFSLSVAVLLCKFFFIQKLRFV